jgi:Zn finger protein HypA/HybF involved in hydrogenase expression
MTRKFEPMGEYECWNCNEIFELDEPPYDGFEICDECRAEAKET